MRMSWKLGRVAGIDVYLHPTFLLLLVFLVASGTGLLGLTVVLAGFGCVVLHELGHALMARRFGIATEDITLYPIGGVARLSRMPRSPGAEILIALAGPAVNVAIIAVLIGLQIVGASWWGPLPTFFAYNLLIVNAMLALFNLIPAFPMDGGRVLRALLTGWLGRVKATQVAAVLGRGLAVVFGLYCLVNGYLPQVFLAGFIYLAAGTELAGVVAEDRRQRYEGDSGVWAAPLGYHWVQQGNGAWQLAPIVVTVREGNAARWN